jgi:hypothetical protein
MLAKLLKNKEKYHIKILGLIAIIITFSIFYLLLDSTHFQGMNVVQDKVKDDIVERESRKVVNQEQFQGDDQESQELKRNIEKVVEDEEEKISSPTIFQNFFDRLYFSIITACLLGYGDIYPATNTAKTLSAMQSFLTVCLILY